MASGTRAQLDELARLIGEGDVVVLTGAGISTESGIPDYRGPNGSLTRHTPMTYQAFIGSPAARQRYWARSHLGWRAVARASANAGHRAVAALQRAGLVGGLITQNVDGLHQAAGADPVVELHGSLDRVVCLTCGDRLAREELERRLSEANPRFTARALAVNPDGDVDLPDDHIAGFRVVDCQVCAGGLLKPDVVFFGEAVPVARVRRCMALVDEARTLLVLGSSLSVLSGRRFVARAAERGIPVAIVNRGTTRGDRYATIRLDAALGEALPALVDRVVGATSAAVATATPG